MVSQIAHAKNLSELFMANLENLYNILWVHIVSVLSSLTLYDLGGGALKAPPPIFCSHAFNFGAALLCVGDFSQKIV